MSKLKHEFGDMCLGQLAEDAITGLKGTIIQLVWMKSGSRQVTLQPRGDGNRIPDGMSIDHQTVKAIDEHLADKAAPVPEIPNILGQEVEIKMTKTRGEVTEIRCFFNGCVYAFVQPAKGWFFKEPPLGQFVPMSEITVLVPPSREEKVETTRLPPRSPGGPMQKFSMERVVNQR